MSEMSCLFEADEWMYQEFPDKSSTWRMIVEHRVILKANAEGLYSRLIRRIEELEKP